MTCETSSRGLRRDHEVAGQPAYTALSREARHVLLASDRTQAVELLDLIGRELMRYRSWGPQRKSPRSTVGEELWGRP